MLPDDRHLTEDVDDFLARAGDFLRSRPALHNTPLTAIEKLRTRRAAEHGDEATVFGRLESGGEVRAIFYRTPHGFLSVTPLSAEQAGTLAARLAGLGHSPSGVIADHDTATAFTETWQRHMGAAPAPFRRTHLYRLGTLTPPQPRPSMPYRLPRVLGGVRTLNRPGFRRQATMRYARPEWHGNRR
ncbi:hypothetical protein AB0J63_44155 [Streptosporangium canum]|uniref:hypothetical protein n=1 Tax=Streptosporangium canum TaxID=324952 RepID=UPI00343D0A56